MVEAHAVDEALTREALTSRPADFMWAPPFDSHLQQSQFGCVRSSSLLSGFRLR
jgi:hypothetical protein